MFFIPKGSIRWARRGGLLRRSHRAFLLEYPGGLHGLEVAERGRKSVSAGANKYELRCCAGAHEWASRVGSAKGAAFYTSSRLNNQGLNKIIFAPD
jgi:hypothetical protein